MEILKLKITGTSPLMMHSAVLANPLLPETKAHKALTSKRVKTDEDHLAIAKSEYLCGLYWSDATGVYIPGPNLDATFETAAAMRRKKTQWKRGALVVTDRVKLLYDGPRTPEALWEDMNFVDCRSVNVVKAKLMRYRPVFKEWAAELELAFNADLLDESVVKKILADAGSLIGVCEYRPRFGRFEVAYG